MKETPYSEIVVGILALMAGLILGSVITTANDQKAAVEHGAGYYDPATGWFTWIERPPVTVEKTKIEE